MYRDSVRDDFDRTFLVMKRKRESPARLPLRIQFFRNRGENGRRNTAPGQRNGGHSIITRPV